MEGQEEQDEGGHTTQKKFQLLGLSITYYEEQLKNVQPSWVYLHN